MHNLMSQQSSLLKAYFIELIYIIILGKLIIYYKYQHLLYTASLFIKSAKFYDYS